MKFIPTYLLVTSLLALKFHQITCSGSLEQYSDDDILNLIRTENYVSVLFSK